MVTILELAPEYTRENGLAAFNLQGLQLPFKPSEHFLYTFKPGCVGGNHKHPRREAFLAMGEDMMIIWRDDSGIEREQAMWEQGKMNLFLVDPLTPHVVVNRSATQTGYLIEWADMEQTAVETVKIV